MATKKNAAAKPKLVDLLGRGYLPEIIPPPFTTTSFASAVCSSTGDSLISPWMDDGHRWHKQISRPIPYTASKSKYSRRLFGIPNPYDFIYVANALCERWDDISQFVATSKYSRSLPSVDASGERSIRLASIDELDQHRHATLSPHSHILKTDVARYFPSIYTHSIPWALHGKPAAKKDKSEKSTAVFGNSIDYFVRRGQDGQTIGIPIGPDTSRVIGEIIGAAIDAKLVPLVKNIVPAGVRHVDDIYLGTNSREDAEEALSSLRSIMRDFELELNESKTDIVESHLLRKDPWVQRLDDTAPKGKVGVGVVDKVFTLAFEETRLTRNEAPIKYALRLLDNLRVYDDASAWQVAEFYLMQCVNHFPHSIDYSIMLLIKRYLDAGDIRKSDWQRIISNLSAQHSLLGNDNEVAWLLWGALSMKLQLDNRAAKQLSGNMNPVCVLLLLDCEHRGLLGAKLNAAAWDKAVQEPSIWGDRWWLVRFESARNQWLSTKKAAAINHEFFDAMAAKSVFFYDTTSSIETLNKHEKAAKAIFIKASPYDVEFDDSASEFADEDPF